MAEPRPGSRAQARRNRRSHGYAARQPASAGACAQHGPLAQSRDHLLSTPRITGSVAAPLALRVRQSGPKFIQTLKTAGTGQGAETSTGEWEVDLPDARRSSPRSTTRRARSDRPRAARRAAPDLRDPVQAPGGDGRVARRQPPAGADRGRIRSWRHPGRRGERRSARSSSSSSAASRAPCSSWPSRCGRWCRCGCSRSTRRRAATAWLPARRRPGARPERCTRRGA